jgi:broad specificity phosphatase PhoE
MSNPTKESIAHLLYLTGSEPKMSAVDKLFACYDDGFAPPGWVREQFVQNRSFHAHASRSVCFYDSRVATKHDVRKVLTEREPVNIGMQKNYDVSRMEQYFGGSGVSGYEEYFDHRETALPPNIAVYCITPVMTTRGVITRHVINSVGMAFDVKSQPDYQYFEESLRTHNFSKILRIVTQAYRFVARCAMKLNLRKIAICHLGGGCFANLFPPGIWGSGERSYLANVWMPAVCAMVDEFKDSIDVLYLVGQNGETNNVHMLRMAVTRRTSTVKVESLGNVPEALEGDHMNDVLFQNAWDPHSVAGNGNRADESLDGHFGRISAISVLTFPPTNPHISYCPVDKPRPITIYPMSRQKEFRKDQTMDGNFMRITVIRHGEGTHNVNTQSKPRSAYNPMLTEKGHEQCSQLAQITKKTHNKIGLVLTSPLTRCVETVLESFPHLIDATVTTQANGLSKTGRPPKGDATRRKRLRIAADANLRERIGEQCSVRSSVTDLKQYISGRDDIHYHHGYSRVAFDMCLSQEGDDDPFEGEDYDETSVEMAERARNVLLDMIELKKNPSDVVVCSHGQFLACMFNHGHHGNGETAVVNFGGDDQFEDDMRKQWRNCDVREFLITRSPLNL